MDVIQWEKVRKDPAALACIPEALARKHCLLPLQLEHDRKTLHLASGHFDNAAAAQIEGLRDYELRFHFALPEDILERIALFYGGDETDIFEAFEPKPAFKEGSPIIEFVKQLLDTAAKQEASDIHLEPAQRELGIRLRIHGVLNRHPAAPKALERPIINRIKLIAHMRSDEQRRPQDGRFEHYSEGRKYSVRVASTPSVHGEALTLRLLEPAKLPESFAELGMPDAVSARFESWIGEREGLVLVTGATGSGKSTTIYTALKQLNKEGKKIITLENPVEYRIDGLNQMNIPGDETGAFEEALKACLRQSPDVLLIGEIRDKATAITACQAALTGHLVLSTLHCNEPEQARTRLEELGVPGYLIDASMLGVLGQKLELQASEEKGTTVYTKRRAHFELREIELTAS